MASSCPSCGADISEGGRFCAQCGAGLGGRQAEASGDPLRDTLEAAIGFQYRIVGLLGRGGMGAVYLARDLALDREVAIKVLPPDRSEAARGRERFRREARTAARLTHPNIVPLLTFGEVRGVAYFVMGFVRGESLAARLRRGPMRPEDARRTLGELADALDHAHRHGVVHRDLKPDNVLLDEETGRALLADFGISKVQGLGQRLTATGSLVGTPHYMSPEQASGSADVDARSDLYSLGVMGYEMLAGSRPFEGESAGDVLAKHLTQPAPPLGYRAASAPVPLVSAIERCLKKDPEERWPDASALRQEIGREESAELPDELRVVHALASIWLAYGLVMLFYGLYRFVTAEIYAPWERSSFVDVLPGLWILLGFSSVVIVYDARRKDHPWRAIGSVALRQPPWWLGWYPRRLRAPRDAWDRLPAGVRRFRAVFFPLSAAWAVALCATVMVGGASDMSYAKTGERPWWGGIRESKVTTHALMAGLGGLGALIGYGAYAVRRRARLASRSVDDGLLGVLMISTSDRSYWSRPGIAALLEPEPGASDRGDAAMPGSPAELEQRLARRLESWPPESAALAEQVRAAVHQCRLALDALDREIASLLGDLDPEEAQRLAARLEALGPERDGEAEERRQMRDLLARQLDLMRGQQSRLSERERERDRRLTSLRELWRVATSGGSPESSAPRLQRLCSELVAGSDETTLSRDAESGAAPRTAPFPP